MILIPLALVPSHTTKTLSNTLTAAQYSILWIYNSFKPYINYGHELSNFS